MKKSTDLSLWPNTETLLAQHQQVNYSTVVVFVTCDVFCLRVELPSSYAELNAVFDVYDVTLSGHINYRELVKSVDRQVCFAYLFSVVLQPSIIVL